jgi:hypothetical protein
VRIQDNDRITRVVGEDGQALGFMVADGRTFKTKKEAEDYLLLAKTIAGYRISGTWKPEMTSVINIPQKQWDEMSKCHKTASGLEFEREYLCRWTDDPNAFFKSEDFNPKHPPSAASPPDTERVMSTSDKWYCIKCRRLVREDEKLSAIISISTEESRNIRTHDACGGKACRYTVEQLASLLHKQMALLEDGVRVAKKLEAEKEAMFKKNDDLQRTYYHPGAKKFFSERQTVHSGIVGRTIPGWDGRVYNVHGEQDMSQMVEHLTQAGKNSAGADLKSKQKIKDLQEQLENAQSQVVQLQEQLKKVQARSMPTTGKSSRNIML